MDWKVFILDIVLACLNVLVKLVPINQHKIAFISLESKVLESDLELIYSELYKKGKYKLVCVLTSYEKNNIWMNFRYFLNTMKQLAVINTSSLVILNDNNYVVSRFKREEITVLQVWHAAGAIKKFGNVIDRKYQIRNYDYVICNSKFWKKPYSEAFNLYENQVIETGMPRLDHLLDETFLNDSRDKLYAKYPQLMNKKIILYAPTFRGDIHVGMKKIDIDLDEIVSIVGHEYIVLYKLHPLLKKEIYQTSADVMNMNDEDIHELFSITDVLVSDFSSIIFDFSIFHKPIYGYVPDLEGYLCDRGCFVDYSDLMGDSIAKNEWELARLIQAGNNDTADRVRPLCFEHADGKNLSRTVALIEKIIK